MATTKSQQDIIKRFMKSLDATTFSGKKALDEAVNYATGGYFSDISSAIDKMIAECKNLGADKFLLQKCGINLTNTDTGAITGKDAGGSKVKTAESIVPESGKLDSNFKSTSFKTNGLTFRLTKSSLTSNEAYIWRALKTWWAKEGLSLIEDSFGLSFNDSDALVKEIDVTFNNKPALGYLAYVNFQNNNGKYKLILNVNTAHFKSFESSDVNGKSTTKASEAFYLDRTIAHELTHAIMMAKVNNYDGLPQFITEGVAELTRGVDDLRISKIKSLAANSASLKAYLNVEKFAIGNSSYAAGYIFLRWLAKQGSAKFSAVNSSENVTIKSNALILSKNYSENVLDLDNYSSKIKTVKAGAISNGIMIYGNDNNNSILSGAGNDTLSGGKGNDTLTGGKGADIFVYTEGKDLITDFSSDDKISLTSDLLSTTLDGSDVIFTICDGSLTVKNAKGKTLNVITDSGKKYSTVLGGTTLNLTNAANSPVTIDSAIKIVDASSRTKAINITGNSLSNSISGGSKNDKIFGGNGKDSIFGNSGKDSLNGGKGNDKIYGGKGNDTIFGGAGNDSLWGDAGADKFVYSSGDGDDFIFGFDDKDTLTFDNLDFKASYKNNSVIFAVSGGSVTLKDFTAKNFHVNGNIYQISGSKLVKK